jgi:hypothetical protein
MKLVSTRQDEADIKADPKTKDRVTWHRIQDLVDVEACHRDWNIALYKLHRIGRINNDQREAGDKYAALVRDKRKLWKDPVSEIMVLGDYDVNKYPGRLVSEALGMAAAEGNSKDGESEFETKRAKRIGERYREAAAIAGPARGILEDLLIDETWPVGERGHIAISHALTRLSHFFNTGTKRKR